MKRQIFIFMGVVALALLQAACNNAAEKNNTAALKAEKRKQVEAQEDNLYKSSKGEVNQQAAAQMIDTYQDYANSFPQDSLSPHYLFRAADISLNVFHSDASVRLFDKIMTAYPNFEGVPQLLFFKAFAYDYYMHKIDSAAKYYKVFLQRYPTHPFATDAEMSLQQLGKTPEEIIEGFKAKE